MKCLQRIYCSYIGLVDIRDDVTIAGQLNNRTKDKERWSYSANGCWKAEMSNN